jgi:hypothetical protein
MPALSLRAAVASPGQLVEKHDRCKISPEAIAVLAQDDVGIIAAVYNKV